MTQTKINSCRLNCGKTYPVHNPIVLPPPPTMPDLGLTKDIPATSCMDIIKWGGVPDSGEKWLKNDKMKEPFKIYCDQKVDGGGWGLFYNYIHKPFEDY
jgi:hypothetical protein